MAKERGYREQILTYLANAACLPINSNEQHTVLNLASSLLWRFDALLFPVPSDELLVNLSRNLEDWLPIEIRSGFTGALLFNNLPTFLVQDITIELSGNPLGLRDDALASILDAESMSDTGVRTFRDLVSRYGLDVVVDRQDLASPDLVNTLYRPMSSVLFEDKVYVCPDCGVPPVAMGDFAYCTSMTCQKIPYSTMPPYRSAPYRRYRKTLRAKSMEHPFQLDPLYIKTIALPLIMETRIINKIHSFLVANTKLQLHCNPDRPGIVIYDRYRSVSLDTVALRRPASILEYYTDQNQYDEIWVVVPKKYNYIFRDLGRKLPKHIKTSNETLCVNNLRDYFKYRPS